MVVDTLHVHYIINGKNTTLPTRVSYEQVDEFEFQNILLEVQMRDEIIRSSLSDSMEYAVKYLQKHLPADVTITCCQSCRYGNFNPYGDHENEIFCLKDKNLRHRDDVVEIFSNRDSSLRQRSRRLLDYCQDYKPISHSETYTYNDWELEK